MPTHKTSRNAILIAISQLSFAELKPFLTSVRLAGIDADVVCFAGDSDAETLKLLRESGVIVHGMREVLVKLPFVQRKLNLLKWAFPLMRLYRSVQLLAAKMLSKNQQLTKREFVKLFGRICTMRFFYYRDFVEANAERYDRIVLTDARDVVFQSDPFATSWNPEILHCFLEAKGRTIASDHWNAYWTKQIGGEALLRQIGNEQISCAGVSFGGTAVMRTYLNTMCAHLEEHIDRLDLDQGFHNLMIWTHQLTSVRLGQCFESEVLTVGLIDERDIRWSDDGKLLNRDGTVIPIVHQYDRHPLLVQRFAEIYGSIG